MFRGDRLGLLGVPFGAGQVKSGVDLAPRVLREAGLVAAIRSAGWGVEDHGDIEVAGAGGWMGEALVPFKHATLVSRVCRETADRVASILSSGRLSLQLGGDHSIALGTIAGALRVYPDLRVIWVDAHGDSNTPESSPSGNFHGMPLAALLGVFAIRDLPGFEWLGDVLRPERVALIGVRDLDREERKIVQEHGIPCHKIEEIRQRGMSAVISDCLRKLDPEGVHPIHYSLDIDALDPSVAGATGLPVEGGLSLAEVEGVGRSLAATGRLVSMDLVEINPLCGRTEISQATVRAGIQSILASLDRSGARLNFAS